MVEIYIYIYISDYSNLIENNYFMMFRSTNRPFAIAMLNALSNYRVWKSSESESIWNKPVMLGQ